MNIHETDSAVARLLELEFCRQEKNVNLIASENYTSEAVMQATASVLTNKYAEGYAHKRYYPGCNIIDDVEILAIERCRLLFGVEHVNVQPHSGSQANMAVYFSFLSPGDTILGMNLADGGHLTHGHGVNFSGTIYNSVQYTVDRDTEVLDYEVIGQLAHKHKPKLIIAGASAYSRIIDFKRMGAIAQEVGAYLLTDIAHIAGLVATGLHPSPVAHADFITSTTHKTLRGPRGGLIMTRAEHAAKIDRSIMPGTQGGPLMNVIAAKAVAFGEALQPSFTEYQKQIISNAKVMAQAFIDFGYRIVSGGTDTHLFVVDVRSKNITGYEAEIALDKVGITVTRSLIPFDTKKPWVTSGIRVGTPAITTRGMKENESREIVHLIDTAIEYHDNETVLRAVRIKVEALCDKFPMYRKQNDISSSGIYAMNTDF